MGGKLTPPAKGTIPVAVAISEGAVVIDFAGPWEVFQDVHVPERGTTMDEIMPFRLFTVSETTRPLRGSAGLQLVPDHTFDDAPQPSVIIVGAQRGSDALHRWLRAASEKADLTMSVCTGAFHLARAGLLSGKAATTHHDSLDSLASRFPDINVRRGLRFVESSPKIATAGAGGSVAMGVSGVNVRSKNLLAVAVVFTLTAAVLAQGSGDAKPRGGAKSPADRLVIVPGEDLKWTDLDPVGAPGVKVADLWGNHAKGAYGAFFKLPAGFASPLHTHTHDIKVVIVSGRTFRSRKESPNSGSVHGPISCSPAGTTDTRRAATGAPSACSSPKATESSISKSCPRGRRPRRNRVRAAMRAAPTGSSARGE